MWVFYQVATAALIGAVVGVIAASRQKWGQFFTEVISSAVVGLAGMALAFSIWLVVAPEPNWIVNLGGSLAFSMLSLWVFSADRHSKQRVYGYPLALLAAFLADLLLFALGTKVLLHKGYFTAFIGFIDLLLVITPVGVLLATTLIGFVLFVIRERLRGVYAWIEIPFGAVTSTVGLMNLVKVFSEGGTSDELQIKLFLIATGLLSGAYVLVRGFDNLEKYLRSEWDANTIKDIEKAKNAVILTGDPTIDERHMTAAKSVKAKKGLSLKLILSATGRRI